MTDRLYYSDSYSQEFDAIVLRVVPWGHAAAVVLDRTAFYPTSGGQPFDTGTLADRRVADVVDADDGNVMHVLEKDAPAVRPGDRVHGRIDWTRRFDHMQQHTGQHVLSAAFDRLFGVRTVSFHLGQDASTIDLAREMTLSELAAAEDEANRIVWEDRQVIIRSVDASEAAALPLRKEPARGGTLRVVEVEGFDLSACGGTHVARTGTIGMIAVLSWERFKGGQRLEFVCGGRALTRLRGLRDAMAATVRLLSVLPAQVPGAVERLQQEFREQNRTITLLRGQLAKYRAAELAADAVESRWGRLVAAAVDADTATLKAIAAAVAARPGYAAVLVSTASPAAVVVARSPQVGISAQQVVQSLTAQCGGRGGGRDELAQAGGVAGESEAILDAAKRIIESTSHP